MNQTLRLLQVEDNVSDSALTVRLLEKAGYDVHCERVDGADEMKAALQREVWDIVIADHHMSQFDAPGALRVLQATGQDIPFIIVSGSIGEDLAVAMMKSGAHDYVNKKNLARLVPVVAREIREADSRRVRAQAEGDLRDSQERLALAVQATQIGTFDFDPRTRRLIWSELTRRHFGLQSNDEVSCDTFFRGLHPKDREQAYRNIQDLLTQGSDGQYAAEYRTVGIDDGVERCVCSWGRVFFDIQGKAVRFVGLTRDITGRKKLEDQFRQAQKMESIGRLAGGVAHDFNNLLTVINGYSDILLDRLEEDDPLHRFASEVRKAGGRAAELTGQLLALGRKQVIDPKPLNLSQLVAGSQNMLARLIGEDIELATRLATDLGEVLADEGQVHQVLMNLVVNARDAMPRGGRLTIETANAEFVATDEEARAGAYILLTVGDSGMGMDEETRKHIFEPFFTTKRAGVGTGLGLAMVYGIVQQCGGWIDLITAPAQGARFTIGLPRTGAQAAADATTKVTAAVAGLETVLVVEDQDEVRSLALLVLKSHGYRLLDARNGREALMVAELHAGAIDLLLTDVVMPIMNGKELADRLLTSRPGMRVLYMSGYSENVITSGGVLSDVNYLAKPFTPAGLASKVRAAISGQRSAVS